MATKSPNLPKLDMSTSTSGCCPIYNPDQWDDKIFELKQRLILN